MRVLEKVSPGTFWDPLFRTVNFEDFWMRKLSCDGKQFKLSSDQIKAQIGRETPAQKSGTAKCGVP